MFYTQSSTISVSLSKDPIFIQEYLDFQLFGVPAWAPKFAMLYFFERSVEDGPGLNNLGKLKISETRHHNTKTPKFYSTVTVLTAEVTAEVI